ncbi:effector-associated constant component EACC1 [Streptomyces sp. YIM 98790]|uniref:effector-associated constant component EACC1 n=1 Tax=Streptomyces sp. YIM 98790 TaxID=2689077 RepID=UPI001A9E68CF|nr:hypothetical protein [Streptomyces sp. YIM 98790]
MHEDPADTAPTIAPAAGPMTVRLAVTPDPDLGLGAEDTERLIRRLRAELAGPDVESVRAEPAGPPPGSAPGGPAAPGSVVVALGTGGGVFATLVDRARVWLGRQAAEHRISLSIDGDTIELERACEEERRALTAAHARRAEGGADAGTDGERDGPCPC